MIQDYFEVHGNYSYGENKLISCYNSLLINYR